ncbi:MAG TPA: 50S ribosomal protein L29 [Gammaproteobacteria bacterium]|jgi:large subunit ribosomal protein L29|nr:50S ribosomal protein L29 [Gammaproteobacteria bacterium]
MIASEIREKSDQELKDALVELRKEQFGLRMQRGTGQLANPARFKDIRRDVARINTIIAQRAAAGEQS